MNTQDILQEAMNLVQKVKDGQENPLAVYGELNQLKKGIDELRKEIYNETIEKIGEYNKKEDVTYGNYLYKVGSRTSYKYEQDPEYTMVKSKLDSRKKLIKKASDMGKTLVDSETGETVDPVETSTSVYPIVTYREQI